VKKYINYTYNMREKEREREEEREREGELAKYVCMFLVKRIYFKSCSLFSRN